MLYTRTGEASESDVLSAHNSLIWEFADGAIAASPTATVQFVVKDNAGSTIYTSSVFNAYLLSFSAPTAQFRFDATEIVKHIINNYFYREMSNDVISPENYGSEIEITFKSYDNAVLEDTEVKEYFASHALNQIGEEYGANIPRMFYNDTEEVAHFLGYPNKLFFYSDSDLSAETPIVEVLGKEENIITSWENVAYDTFASTGSTITSAINTAFEGLCRNPLFSIRAGESVRVVFNLTLNSGTAPTVGLYDAFDLTSPNYPFVSNTVVASAGDNCIILTALKTKVGDCRLVFYNATGVASNFSTDAVHAQKLIAYSNEGTFGQFVHALDLFPFKLSKEVKQVRVLYDPTDPTLIKEWNLSVFDVCENAVYIRYLNSEGYYAFWAFSFATIRDKSGEPIGSVINSFSLQATANARNNPIGYRDARDKISASSPSVPSLFQRKLMEIFTSPAVYIWQGGRNSGRESYN